MQGVGSSLPGFVHGLLFCALTMEVRDTMMKGLWSGLVNCEICIYDKSCGTSCVHRKQRSNSNVSLNNQLGNSSITAPRTSSSHAAKSGLSSAMLDTLSDYDIVESPDPTGSVRIIHIPEVPRYFPDDEDSSY